ncbi:YqhR family membrane protein [Caldibacillus lycopersici]|uniref:YqhR family membrane protein n=1 Tax=Perspicuibacillus lycopersici TaxID=1325689 RepID=A0AAE3ISV7_9BACI|nr:YqhR family membrane protein [Perspicuibacillus lycopersici]MCU9613846.1 YqhR family membrane protein [Perspicuibacillus lycopersici]
MQKAKLEQNQHAKPISASVNAVLTGFVGGLFWSALGLLAYYFHFTEIRPNMILEPWALGAWKTKWLGTVISLIVIGLFGIGAALLYYIALRKFRTIWIGIGYGAILFALVFFVLNPLFPSLNPLHDLNYNTIITTLCLYILFGVFVGYSISYEYNEQNFRKHHEDKDNESLKTV